ncbi:Ribonuclease VapC44 [Geodia barretti]|uniref:Ribonuclease VapC44 n=1 Tax=Geodia barretti TaxID=519541 RepID=A0AA35TBL8_GEOBA|nr:Ribonuclease VapC44 [Geodia barretti]
MLSLFDVNVLVALLDQNHGRHEIASNWFDTNSLDGWATCPITQNGCIRLLSQPGYPNPLSVSEAIGNLRTAVSDDYHQFILDDISILDGTRINSRGLSGHRQLTDVYLLALPVTHDARLVTLDTHIPRIAVKGATEDHLVVI